MRDLLSSTNRLSPFADSFGLRGRSHDFTVPLWEPPIVGFPGIGLGVVFCFSIGIGIAFRSLDTSVICLNLGARQQRRRSTPVFLQPSRHQSPENLFLLPSVRLDHEMAEELRVISKIRDSIRPLSSLGMFP